MCRHNAILMEEPGLRLTFLLLACFSLSSATAATQWRAHYVPINGPWGGLAQGLAVDSSGNIFVSATAESSGESQTCLFKLDAQGNLRGEICFGSQASSAVAVGPDGNPVVAGHTYFAGSVQLVSPLISQTGSEAGYVIKFNSDLTAIIFSTLVGGTTGGSLGGGTVVSALALDQAGNI